MSEIQCVAMTVMGKVRTNNQDNLYCQGQIKELELERFLCEKSVGDNERFVCAVADGMGGLRYGEEAAFCCVYTLKKYLDKKKKAAEVPSMRSAIRHMNRSVCKLSRIRNAEMGSTITILKCVNGKAAFYNLGDSKGFIFRDSKLLQMTQDHTEKESIRRMKAEMGGFENTSNKNALTQYVGIEEEEFVLEPGVSKTMKLEQGDIFLLSSDGLTGMVEISDIEAVLDSVDFTMEEKTKKLVDMALEAGGKDNITVLLAKVC